MELVWNLLKITSFLHLKRKVWEYTKLGKHTEKTFLREKDIFSRASPQVRKGIKKCISGFNSWRAPAGWLRAACLADRLVNWDK